jgi:Fusaric acid resistance protein-like
MRAARLRHWLDAKDPGLVAVKRALRVTLVACAAFYFSLYVLDDSQMATFASFGCIAFGALSEVTGEPWQRTKTYAVGLLVAIVLVTLGTALAISTWAAAAGMFVVGFGIAYAGVGGPRVVGVANGLQLLYILPSFPPYLPEALGSRLIGLILAVVLLAIADRVLWPPPVPTPFRHRLAEAIRQVRDRLTGLLALVGDRQPPAGSAPATSGGAITLRLSRIPPLQRPTGPGRRDRAAIQAATLLRGAESRVTALAELAHQHRPAVAHDEGATLLDVTARSLSESAEAIAGSPDGSAQGQRADPDPTQVQDALARYVQLREARAATAEVDHDMAIRLRSAVAVEELAVWTRDLAEATKIMLGERVPEPRARSVAEPFWYANRSAPSLWFTRFVGHFTPRSVFFQNAIRLAIGLTAARLIAGVLDLSHGFWMLLATLTLMRTSVATTRAAVVPAFLGTVVGGLLAALVLALAGGDSVVYEVALPFVMIIAIAAGPLAGVVAGQASFTLLVAMLFAQMAPVSWRLAEVRVLDVVLGGLLGAVVGLLVWPLGAQGEMRRTARATLDAAANDLESTVRSLTHRQIPSSDQQDTATVAVHLLALTDSTYAQYRSELRSTPDPVDWLGVLGLAHEVVRGGQALRRTHGTAGPLPWPGVADELEELGSATAEQLRAIGGLLNTKIRSSNASSETAYVVVDSWISTSDGREVVRRRTDPVAAVRVLDLWGWLTGVAFDCRRVADGARAAAQS